MTITPSAKAWALAAAIAAAAPAPALPVHAVLRAGHTHMRGDPTDVGLHAFASELARLSSGRIEVKIFPEGALGDEFSMSRDVITGRLDICMVGGQMVESLYPPYAATNIPYVFDSYEHLKAFIRSDGARKALLNASAGAGFTGMWLEAAAPRSFFAKFPITSPSDLKGLVIRVPESEMSIRTARLLGATPNPLSTMETYTALEHSVIDGAENNFVYYVQQRYYEVAPVFSNDMHSMSPNVVILSQKSRDHMTLKEWKWVEKAAAAGREAQIAAYEAEFSKLLGFAKALGIQMIKVDRGPFIEATRQILEESRRDPSLSGVIKAIDDSR